jgi:hypothetical protein
LDDSKLAGPGTLGGVAKHRQVRHTGRDLFEQLQPFSAHSVFGGHKPSDIAAGPRQAFNEAATDRITSHREHDRHGAGRLQQRPHSRSAVGQDDVGRERNQFRRVPANVVSIRASPAGVDPHVAADTPARFLQTLQERT